MKYLRWLLLPFSLIYGLVVILRSFCYDAGLLKTVKFKKPVISVGNLDVGGAGKSPMTEYLISLLKNDHRLATLSRGYGRNTKGYILADTDATATTLGDEPAQFKHKFPNVTVAVCEDRVQGLINLMPDHDLVLLDDAYQHRAVTPGLSILLFDYSRLDQPHLLLPAGNLREPFSGRWRAQVLVVTKCPRTLTIDAKEAAADRLAPLPYQSLFFASIAYQPLLSLAGSDNKVIDAETTVFLLTGIANSAPLLQYLSGLTTQVIHHKYPDHHQFTPKNIAKLAAEFSACSAQKKLIVTTEKDAQRLDISWFKRLTPEGFDLPVFVLPIKVEFLDDSGGQFDQLVINYVREHTAYNGLH
jgi:tetraacyldisaccharide 4'-kinase